MELTLNYLKVLRNWFLDLLLPQKCIGCQLSGYILCENCISKIPRTGRETENNIYACFDYRDSLIKKAIWNLKYYNRKTLGQKLGNLLYNNLIEEISEIKLYRGENPIYVIPVPLSLSKKRARGYNQAEVIARNFCESGEKNLLELKNNILIKKIDTPPQARITNRAERLRNIHGAFSVVNPSYVKGQAFIIVDDVTTTGGTLTEIMKILKESGAKSVVGFTIAH